MQPGKPEGTKSGRGSEGQPGRGVVVVILSLVLAIFAASTAVLSHGCVSSRDATRRHLDALRGKPAAPSRGHATDTVAALEQLSRADGVEVDLPTSIRRTNGLGEWCAGGEMQVGGRSVPFGIRMRELEGALSIVDMSLARRRCVSEGSRHNRSTSLR